jgi:alanine racemase
MLPKGQAVGYNGTFTTTRESRIAVLPVGYADGLNRQLSSQGRVIVRGRFAPIVGRISMDLTLIDVTEVSGVEIGDEVVLIGSVGGLSITAWEHATLAATIPYEILCNISKRVPRKYVG